MPVESVGIRTCNLKSFRNNAFINFCALHVFQKKTPQSILNACFLIVAIFAILHFQSLSYGDTCEHAAMSEVVRYLRVLKCVSIPEEWRPLLPQEIQSLSNRQGFMF